MTGYQTQQRNLLVSFFESHPDEAFTIDEITQQMRSEQGDATPSRSTVYRTVADLEKENYLKRTGEQTQQCLSVLRSARLRGSFAYPVRKVQCADAFGCECIGNHRQIAEK